jgi:hypothetical protein
MGGAGTTGYLDFTIINSRSYIPLTYDVRHASPVCVVLAALIARAFVGIASGLV